MRGPAVVAAIVVLALAPMAGIALTGRDVGPAVPSALFYLLAPAVYPLGLVAVLGGAVSGYFEVAMVAGLAAATAQCPLYGLLLRRRETRRARVRGLLTVHLTLVSVYALVAGAVWLLNRR